jgi:hypothetical protein
MPRSDAADYNNNNKMKGAPIIFALTFAFCCQATTPFNGRPWVEALWWYEEVD